jgi:hypothetical protein
MTISMTENNSRFNVESQITRVKEKVEEQHGVPPAQQRLIFDGRQLYVIDKAVCGHRKLTPNPGQTRKLWVNVGSKLAPRCI